MLVGFVHGVMNTDNMTISGETIDYGPCAFLDAFDPATVFSSIDTGGRYAYGNQPVVAEWNLARFAEALLPLLADDQDAAVAVAVEALGAFRDLYSAAWSAGMRRKLGLPADVDAAEASSLVTDLVALEQADHVDHTSFFRSLGAAARGDAEPARGMFLDLAGFDAWTARWRALDPDADAMDRTNPVYVPRNHLVEEALSAATGGDLAPLDGLLDAVSAPYDERPGPGALRRARPRLVRRLHDLLRDLAAGDGGYPSSRPPSSPSRAASPARPSSPSGPSCWSGPPCWSPQLRAREVVRRDAARTSGVVRDAGSRRSRWSSRSESGEGRHAEVALQGEVGRRTRAREQPVRRSKGAQ